MSGRIEVSPRSCDALRQTFEVGRRMADCILSGVRKEVCWISVFLWEFGHNMTALHYHSGKESHRMNWVYYGKLYTSKFQAGCFAKRLEQDGWLFGYHDPRMVEVYRSKKGRYGVRFMP